ncbi:MAG: hypothetical protein IPM82_32460 [Saprospiraceae bacterium]|nr:hypothetical protein [Saprospiraceae bacterium]
MGCKSRWRGPFENNYAFLRKTSLLQLLNHRNDVSFVAAEDVEGPLPDNTFVVDFFNDGAKRFVNVTGFVAGPSLAVRLGESHSVGIFTNLRTAAGSVNIPNEFSYYKYDARPFQAGFEIPKMRVALLNWSEIGLNYALKVPTADGSMNFGISLKYLQGYEAGYIDSESSYEHTKLPGNTITLGLPNGRYGYAASSESAVFSERNGRGLGADLGFTWISQDHEDGYRLKLGASLLDLGYLKFNKNAQAHHLQLDSTVTVELDDYDNFDLPNDLETVIRTFSENSLNDSLSTYEGSSFRMALPAALSLQADYGVTEHIYVNALYTQRLPTFSIGPRRSNLLAVTPRWQHRWLSVSAPISVYNWSRVHVGLAARLGWLVIGSDDLAGVF